MRFNTKLRTLFSIFLGTIFLSSCAQVRPEDQSNEDLSNYIWTMTLVTPAIHAAMGPFDEQGLRAATVGLSSQDQKALIAMSVQAFHPAKVYGKIQKRALNTLSRNDLLRLSKSLDSKVWNEFAENLLYYYSEEGSEKVAQVMREIDQEKYELDLEKARSAEKLSQSSYNFKTVDILYSKMPGGSPAEKFLYQESLLVTTYLALKDFTPSQIRKLKEVRSDETYQKFKLIFENVIDAQYNQFFLNLKNYTEKQQAG